LFEKKEGNPKENRGRSDCGRAAMVRTRINALIMTSSLQTLVKTIIGSIT